MILIKDILTIHNASIELFGGSKGIRDLGMLKSAIGRPFQTFGGKDLYPSPFEKAADLCESIIINPPLLDGNKRTGFSAMVAVLMEYGFHFTATQEEAYQTMIAISTGGLGYEGLKNWLLANTMKK